MSEQDKPFQIRDARGGWFIVENVLFRGGYGAKIGPYGIAVYAAMAMHANATTQELWPSYNTIAKLTGMSRRQVIRKVEELIDLGMIDKQSRYQGQEVSDSNLYTLLPTSMWKKIGGGDSQSLGVVTHSHQGGDSQSPEQDSMNKTNTNNSADADEEEEEQSADDLFDELFPREDPVETAGPEKCPEGMTVQEWHRLRTEQAHQDYFDQQTEQPWLAWRADYVRARNGISKPALQHVGWLIESKTGLTPTDAEMSGWVKALASVYQAGKGNWDAIAAGIDATWDREVRYRPGHANGFVKEVRKAVLAAEDRQDVSDARLALARQRYMDHLAEYGPDSTLTYRRMERDIEILENAGELDELRAKQRGS